MGKISGIPFSRRNSSASRSGSPGIGGRWFQAPLGRAKDAYVVVHLALERIDVHEAIDAHGTEEMADAFANAALRSFLTQGERRREGTPIGAAEHRAQHVDHDGQTVALVPSAFAVGA